MRQVLIERKLTTRLCILGNFVGLKLALSWQASMTPNLKKPSCPDSLTHLPSEKNLTDFHSNQAYAEPLILVLTTLVFAISLALVQREHWPLAFNVSIAVGLVAFAIFYQIARFRLARQVKINAVDQLTQWMANGAALGVGVAVLIATVAAWHGQDVNSQILLSWIASIWSLSATFTLAAAPITWSLLAVPVWMAVTILWFAEGTFTGFGAGVASFAAVAMQAWFVKHSNKKLRLAYQQTRENADLIVQLESQRAESDRLRLLAEEANQAKTRFLASASHDLRQPLTALTLFAETLSQLVKTKQLIQLSGHIHQSVQTLEKLFNSLLDLSKLDAGIIHVIKKRFSVTEMLARLADEYQEQATAKGLIFVTNFEEEWIETDPVLFERMLRNLLENALRYTARGSIRLRCQRRLSKLAIDIVDTGPGIAPSERAKIFDEYYQIANPGRDRTKGLGIGLAIVRRIADLLQCEMSLESNVGEGSTFRIITLAAERPVVSPTAVKPFRYAVDGTLKGWRVLVLDDDPEIREAARMLLELQGCDVILAATRAECFSRCGSKAPDIVIADYRLADGETGLDVLTALKVRFGDIKGVVLTGDTAPERLREVVNSGYTILHKPISATQLQSHVREALGLPFNAAEGINAEQSRASYRL